jgi:hypothetical protein
MSGAGSSAKASALKPSAAASLPTQVPTGPGSVASAASSGPSERSGSTTVTPEGESSTSAGGSSEWRAARKRRRAETAEERTKRYTEEEIQRKRDYPDLYAKGFTDREVRAFIRGPEAFRNLQAFYQSARGKTVAREEGRGRGGGRVGAVAAPSGQNRGRGQPANRGATARPGKQPESRKRGAPGRTGQTPPAKVGSEARPSGAAYHGSYRSAAVAGSIRGKVAEYPFLLSVHVGKTERQPLPESVWDKITAKLSKCILDLIRRPDHIRLKTDYLAYANGSGKIACLTAETGDWYRNAIDHLDIEGVGFRAWANDEEGELRPARMVGTGLEDFSPGEIVEVIMAMTDPPLKGRMQHLRSETLEGGKGQLHFIGIDDQMAWSLHNLSPPWTVDIGTFRRKLKYPNKPALALRLREAGVIQALEAFSVHDEETDQDK